MHLSLYFLVFIPSTYTSFPHSTQLAAFWKLASQLLRVFFDRLFAHVWDIFPGYFFFPPPPSPSFPLPLPSFPRVQSFHPSIFHSSASFSYIFAMTLFPVSSTFSFIPNAYNDFISTNLIFTLLPYTSNDFIPTNLIFTLLPYTSNDFIPTNFIYFPYFPMPVMTLFPLTLYFLFFPMILMTLFP